MQHLSLFAVVGQIFHYEQSMGGTCQKGFGSVGEGDQFAVFQAAVCQMGIGVLLQIVHVVEGLG